MLKQLRKKIGQYNLQRGFARLKKRIERLDNNLNGLQLLEFSFSKKAELIQPWQFIQEISELVKIIENKKPKIVLEIGTANGGTLFLHSRLADGNATIISIDLPQGKFGGGYPERKIPLYKSFAKPNQQIHLLRCDSHLQTTYDNIKSILNGKKIDYFFIDGDHTYEGVKKDFFLYKNLLSENAIVAFHDIVEHPHVEGENPDKYCSVDLFWKEIRQQYPYKEFVNDWNQKCFGIGVLHVNKKQQ